ncbi:DUF1905 domain-containing protein [Stackebrandtia nassauensis]|uniref:DUF1905 domain-containing protein n=1 Tax=Stackebrandtia nassauensis (strain DSM 44728 / CIP 108903 / NRRL B-16338 / NBRC 102104 / LLR-40K-21) TaxID=446470 RepID=D3Q030_STANL|nr:DUF1905 domain-containing protein [Stackebrandtia nassauensis]ADD45559.1 Domain of unknown function DUF1905 [Stackebrandtia nassauensis DSM 44728]
MTTTTRTPRSIDETITATITKDGNSGWACVVLPGSAQRFGTGKAVKVAGTADGHPFEATMLPIGGGTHMLPLRAALRKTAGKDVGDEITIRLRQRFS